MFRRAFSNCVLFAAPTARGGSVTLDPREQLALRTRAVLPLKPSTGLPQDACEAFFFGASASIRYDYFCSRCRPRCGVHLRTQLKPRHIIFASVAHPCTQYHRSTAAHSCCRLLDHSSSAQPVPPQNALITRASLVILHRSGTTAAATLTRSKKTHHGRPGRTAYGAPAPRAADAVPASE